MSKMKACLLGALVSTSLCVKAEVKDADAYALMTARDMSERAVSNVTITNRTSKPITVSGLYIASYDINDCSMCFGSVISGDNLGGTMITPVTFKKDQAVPIGQNFLYNMIYNGITFIRNNVGSSPCLLPGCSWPGDLPNFGGWCLSINAASLNSDYTYSRYTNGRNKPAKVPPFSVAGNSTPFNYKYALVNPTTLGVGRACIGPIICDDKTLNCKAKTAQNQSFRPYH